MKPLLVMSVLGGASVVGAAVLRSLRSGAATPTFPSRERARDVHRELELARAVEAYRFFYPVVSMEALMMGNRAAGLADNEAFMCLSADPRHLIFTANSDTPYAAGVLDLRRGGPMVVEIPAGPYVGLVNDHYHRWIVDMGLPGPDAGEGGRYLIVPRAYDGALPEGYVVARASTHCVFVAVRALPVDGDFQRGMRALKDVKIHPLDAPSARVRYVDVTDRDDVDSTPLRWETSLDYWEALHRVVDGEPPLDEFRPMYGELSSLGIEKGKPFAPAPATRDALLRAAAIGREQMLVQAFASRRSDRIVWRDRRWEWVGLRPENGDFEASSHLDVEARDRWFYQAIIASPAMFRRMPGQGSVYWLTARDRDGEYLDGGRTYRLRVPTPVPASLFWSVTVYDAETRSELRSRTSRAALRSLSDPLPVSSEGTVDLYFGPRPTRLGPFLETVPGRNYFLYFRIYGPRSGAVDGSWRPGDLEAL